MILQVLKLEIVYKTLLFSYPGLAVFTVTDEGKRVRTHGQN